MNAGMRLVAVVALIWALAAAGGMGDPAAKAASRPGGECDEFGCGTNHNETLVRDGAVAQRGNWSNHNETMVRDAAR